MRIPLINRLKHSLPARLLLVFVTVCFCVVALIIATLMHGFGSQWDGGIKPHLNQYLNYVNADIGNPPDITRAEELAKILPLNIYIEGPEQQYSSTGISLDLEKLKFEKQHRRWGNKKNNRLEESGLSTLSFGELDDRTVLRNQLGEHTVYFEVLHRDARAHGSGAIVRAMFWLLLILAGSFWFIRRMLRPVQDVKIGVKRMGQGELDYRVPVRADNDLGELAGSINNMAEGIDGLLDAKRQLLLSLSHELRSPLTRAKIAVQMLDKSKTSESIDEDLSEMQSLISEILEAERINGQHAALNRIILSPTDLIHASAEEFPEADLKLELQPRLPKMALDETRIRLLLRNLINNALTHSQNAENPPVVSAKSQGNVLEISVKDFGAGIAEEHIAHLTEPFYRADASRTRSTGGFGLGLHLCKLIAEAHGGELHITSKFGEGSTMSVSLPTDKTESP